MVVRIGRRFHWQAIFSRPCRIAGFEGRPRERVSTSLQTVPSMAHAPASAAAASSLQSKNEPSLTLGMTVYSAALADAVGAGARTPPRLKIASISLAP